MKGTNKIFIYIILSATLISLISTALIHYGPSLFSHSNLASYMLFSIYLVFIIPVLALKTLEGPIITSMILIFSFWIILITTKTIIISKSKRRKIIIINLIAFIIILIIASAFIFKAANTGHYLNEENQIEGKCLLSPSGYKINFYDKSNNLKGMRRRLLELL